MNIIFSNIFNFYFSIATILFLFTFNCINIILLCPKIKDLQETDAGIYQCQVLISATNSINAEVDLQVRRPPIISDNTTRNFVSIFLIIIYGIYIW